MATRNRWLASGHLEQRGVLTEKACLIMRTSLLIRVTLASALGLLAYRRPVTSVVPLAQSRPKFFSDDPIAREPETQDASKVQSWDDRPHRRPDAQPVRQARRPDAGRPRAEHQHD